MMKAFNKVWAILAWLLSLLYLRQTEGAINYCVSPQAVASRQALNIAVYGIPDAQSLWIDHTIYLGKWLCRKPDPLSDFTAPPGSLSCFIADDIPPGYYNVSIRSNTGPANTSDSAPEDGVYRYPIPGQPTPSLRNCAQQISYNGTAFDVAILPSITSVSPNAGSRAGGTVLSLYGSGLLNTVPNSVTNGTARSFCTVIRASNNAYSCVTGPPVVFDQPFSGSQGVKRQLWNADILSRNASLALNFPLANPDFQEILTTPSLKFTYSAQPFVQTFSTILTLPNNFSGFSTLWVSSSGWTDVNVTSLQDQKITRVLRSRVSCTDFFCDPSQQSGNFSLRPGQRYLLEAAHQHWQGPAHFQLAAIDNSYNNNASTVHEVQRIGISALQLPEVVEIAVQNATAGSYLIQSSFYRDNQLQFETTRPISWNENPQQALSQLLSVGTFKVVPVPAFNGLTWSCPLENLGQGVNLTVAANNLTCAINTSCSVIATVTQERTPPIQGGFSLMTAADQSPLLSWGAPAEDVEESLNNLGLNCTVLATTNATGGYNYTITFSKTSSNMGLIAINASSLVVGSSSQGVNTSAALLQASTSQLFFGNLPVQMLTVPQNTSQVVVRVNDLPAVCLLESGNCPFAYTESLTPFIAGVLAEPDASGNVSVTIVGSNFTPLPQNSTSKTLVYVANAACDVTSQNDALIVCSIKNLGLAGANNVSVYVPGKGNAALTNGSVTTTAFVNPLIISGVSPQAISRAGGGYVTLTGEGFGSSAAQVQIIADGSTSPVYITNITQNALTFIAPPSQAQDNQAFFIRISDVTQTFTVTYSDAATPKVLGVLGGVQSPNGRYVIPSTAAAALTITGTGFGVNSSVSVTVGSYNCSVTSVNNTAILCTVGPGPSGLVPVRVIVSPVGEAVGNLTVTRDFAITSISPNTGSYAGGTVLFLRGIGFPIIRYQTLAVTLVGNNNKECTIMFANATLVRCMIVLNEDTDAAIQNAAAPQSYDVRLTANSRVAGCSVNTGCEVLLQPPQNLRVIGASPDVVAYAGNLSIEMADPLPTSDLLGSIVVYLNAQPEPGVEDSQQTLLQQQRSSNITNLPTCRGVRLVGQSLQCQLSNNALAGQYTVLVWHPMIGFAPVMPLITVVATFNDIKPQTSPLGGTLLTITGNGFVNTSLAVTVADQPCALRFRSNTQLIFRTPHFAEERDTEVKVFGAVYKSSPILVPGYGNSTSGRRKLSQLSGTPPLLGAPQLVGTPAEAPASELENGSFLLSYVRVTSPQLYSASLTFPQLQNGTISIQGEGFSTYPDRNEIGFTHGNLSIAAGVNSATSTQLGGTIAGLEAGTWEVEVYTDGAGYAYAEPPIFINVTLDLNSVSPSSGGILGGTLLTVTGVGIDYYSRYNLGVKVCNLPCDVQGSAPGQLYCLTPAMPGTVGNMTCDVTVSISGQMDVLRAAFSYSVDLTPIITSVSPDFGPMRGGTLVTFLGTNLLPKGAFRDDYDGWFSASAGGSGSASTETEGVYGIVPVAIQIGGLPCQVLTGANSSVIQCQTTPGRNGPFYPQYDPTKGLSVRVGVNGFAELNGRTFTYQARWSDPGTWPGAILPSEGDDVAIPETDIVLLDISPPSLGTLSIYGRLSIMDLADVKLAAETIVINGSDAALNAGSATQPHLKQVDIVLGNLSATGQIARNGTAGGIIVQQGTLALHGMAVAVPWTHLVGDSLIGDTSFTAAEPVDWQANQTLILPPSSLDTFESEIHLIGNVTAGVQIQLSGGLIFDHKSSIPQNITSEALQPEVGLAERSISIIGVLYNGDGQGAYVDARGNSSLVLNNTACFTCGQDNGSAAVNVEDLSSNRSSFITSSVIYSPRSRAIAVRNASNINVNGNVIAFSRGHGVSIEASSGIAVQGNLLLGGSASSQMTPSDQQPAGIYTTAWGNSYRGNVVSGMAIGFWMDISNLTECASNLSDFQGNTAHSNSVAGMYITGSVCPAQDLPAAVINSFTAYRHRSSGLVLDGLERATVQDSLFVENGRAGIETLRMGETGTLLEGVTFAKLNSNGEDTDPPSLLVPSDVSAREGNVSVGWYASGWTDSQIARNVTIVSGRSPELLAFASCARCSYPSLRSPGVRFSQVSGVSYVGEGIPIGYPTQPDGVIGVQDGTLVGSSGAQVVQSRPYLEADCQTLSVLPGSAICGGSGGADILRLTVSAEQEPWHFNSLSISNEVINTATNISRVGNAWAAPLLSNQTYVLALTDQRMTALEFEIYPLTPLSSVTLQMTLSNSTDLLSVEFGNRSLQLGQQLPPNSTVSTASFDAGTRLLSLSFVGSANGLSQAFRANLRPCAESICGSNQTAGSFPVAPFSNYLDLAAQLREPFTRLWSNATQWPGGVLPLPGKDVTIPTGWTLQLDAPPAPLGVLTIQGSLIFKDGIGSLELRARSIYVVPGGYLQIGTRDSPYLADVTLTLTGSQIDNPLPLDKKLGPLTKALVVEGSMSLVGRPFPHAWTRLAESTDVATNALEDSSLIRVVDEVDWTSGEELYIAPSGFDYLEGQILKIQTVQQGAFILNNALSAFHYGSRTLETVGSLELEKRAEVVFLNRSIQIQGTDSAFGCHVLLAPDSESVLQGIRILGCGQSTLSKPALQISSAQQASIVNCTVQDSKSYGIAAQGTDGLQLQNNAVVNSVGSSVSIIDSPNARIIGNVAAGARPRSNQPNAAVYEPVSNFQLCAWDNFALELASPCENLTVQDNIAAGSSHFGFLSQGDSECRMSTRAQNIAHSSRIGALFFNQQESSCLSVGSGFVIHHSFEAGLVFNAFAVDLRVNNMVLAANRVGLIALPVCREQQDPSQLCSVEISDIWLIGEPDLENCYNVNPSSEGSSCTLPEALTASPEGVCSTRTGILTPVFESYAKPFPRQQPWLDYWRVVGDASPGVVDITNITLSDWTKQPYWSECPTSALQVNPSSLDLNPVHQVSRLNFNNTEEASTLSFGGPQTSSGACEVEECGSLQSNLLTDLDGSLLGMPGQVISLANQAMRNDSRCTETVGNGGLRCTGTEFKQMVLSVLGPDMYSPSQEPMSLISQNSFLSTESDQLLPPFQDHRWDGGRPSNIHVQRFSSIVEAGDAYELTLPNGTSPQSLSVQVIGDLPNPDEELPLQVSIRYGSLNVYSLLSSAISSEAEDNLLLSGNATASASANDILTAILEPGVRAVRAYVVPGVTLQVFMDLSPQEYQQLGGQGSFIEAVASYLSISTESIHPIGPAEASTIVVATGRRLLAGKALKVGLVITAETGKLSAVLDLLQQLNSTRRAGFPSSFWQTDSLAVTAPQESPALCLPSCKVFNGRDVKCIKGTCQCTDPRQTYISPAGAESLYTNASASPAANAFNAVEGCQYIAAPTPFPQERSQDLPPPNPPMTPQLTMPPSSGEVLPPPLAPESLLEQQGTNMSRRLQVPVVKYQLPDVSMGASQSIAATSAPSPYGDLVIPLISTAYPTSNTSSALQVLDETVSFGITFAFKGMPALVETWKPSILDVETRPGSLPLMLTVTPSNGESNSSFFVCTVEKSGSQSWGGACGGPLVLGIALPARALQDVDGHPNGASNILEVNWWPPSLLSCNTEARTQALSDGGSPQNQIVFNLLLPGIELQQFQDPSFEQSFIEEYRRQVAGAAGVPLSAVSVNGIQSSGVLVQTQVSYTSDESSQLARQAFLQSLVTNASHVFDDTSFVTNYGQPQAVLVNETTPEILSAPPPPAPPAPLIPTPPPYLNIASAARVIEIPVSKAATIALPSTLLGMACIAFLLVSVLWLLRRRRVRLLAAEEAPFASFRPETDTDTPTSRGRRLLSQLTQTWGAIQRQEGYGPSTPVFLPRSPVMHTIAEGTETDRSSS